MDHSLDNLLTDMPAASNLRILLRRRGRMQDAHRPPVPDQDALHTTRHAGPLPATSRQAPDTR